jgi:hypothetical protein
MILTGKFFEYLAARRPILCIGPPDGDAAKILEKTQAGLLSGHGDIKSLQDHITSFYRQYKSGKLICKSRDIEEYSRVELTGRLAKVLDRITIRS